MIMVLWGKGEMEWALSLSHPLFLSLSPSSPSSSWAERGRSYFSGGRAVAGGTKRTLLPGPENKAGAKTQGRGGGRKQLCKRPVLRRSTPTTSAPASSDVVNPPPSPSCSSNIIACYPAPPRHIPPRPLSPQVLVGKWEGPAAATEAKAPSAAVLGPRSAAATGRRSLALNAFLTFFTLPIPCYT